MSQRQVTGCDDLRKVTAIELTVDTHDRTISALGEILPNLEQLRLSNSSISSIRDLGTSLGKLQILWMARCGLKELDGISLLLSLKELYLAFNDIEDLGPLSGLEFLQVLDLDSNNVSELTQLQYLSQLPLTSLNLESNPVEQLPGFREGAARILPRLQLLDDTPLERPSGEDAACAAPAHPPKPESTTVKALPHLPAPPATQPPPSTASPETPQSDAAVSMAARRRATEELRLDMELVVQGIKKAKRLAIPTYVLEEATISHQPSLRASLQRPRTAMGIRKSDAAFLRASTSLLGVSRVSGFGPSAASASRADPVDTASELTSSGDSIVCGNPAQALKARRLARISVRSLDNAHAILDHVLSSQLSEARTLLTATQTAISPARPPSTCLAASPAASNTPADRGSIPISVAGLSRPGTAASGRPQRPSTSLGFRSAAASMLRHSFDSTAATPRSARDPADEQERRFRELASRIIATADVIVPPSAASPQGSRNSGSAGSRSPVSPPVRGPSPTSPPAPAPCSAASPPVSPRTRMPPRPATSCSIIVRSSQPTRRPPSPMDSTTMPPPPPSAALRTRRLSTGSVQVGAAVMTASTSSPPHAPPAPPAPASPAGATETTAVSTARGSTDAAYDEEDILRASGHVRLAAAAAAMLSTPPPPFSSGARSTAMSKPPLPHARSSSPSVASPIQDGPLSARAPLVTSPPPSTATTTSQQLPASAASVRRRPLSPRRRPGVIGVPTRSAADEEEETLVVGPTEDSDAVLTGAQPVPNASRTSDDAACDVPSAPNVSLFPRRRLPPAGASSSTGYRADTVPPQQASGPPALLRSDSPPAAAQDGVGAASRHSLRESCQGAQPFSEPPAPVTPPPTSPPPNVMRPRSRHAASPAR